MKTQTIWGVEVDVHRWFKCPTCGQEIEVSPLPQDEDMFICPFCDTAFSHRDVKDGRMKWDFPEDISAELAEKIISELREDASKWGATFTVTRKNHD